MAAARQPPSPCEHPGRGSGANQEPSTWLPIAFESAKEMIPFTDGLSFQLESQQFTRQGSTFFLNRCKSIHEMNLSKDEFWIRHKETGQVPKNRIVDCLNFRQLPRTVCLVGDLHAETP